MSASTGRDIGGRYVIEGELARGAMGQVLLVRHRELDKRFALKVLGAAGADPEARAAFYREARLAAALDHPHVVQVYDFGDDEQHGLYLVMELLQGETVGARLRREHRLAPIAACDIIAQTADALEYVHARGLVHGDVKPENIFLSPMPGAPPAQVARRNYVRLLDFGLSRPRLRPGAATESLTHAEGTPCYMAPEVAQGLAPEPASDLYSLGASLFELLTGQPPFYGTIQDVMHAQIHVKPPSVMSVRGAPIPDEIEALVARLLAKDAPVRGGDAHVVAVALRGCVAALGGRRKLLLRPDAGRSRMAAEVVDAMSLAFFVVSPTSLILFSNPAMDRLIGPHSDEIRLGSTRLAEVFPRIERDVRAVLARGREVNRRGLASDGAAVILKLWPHQRHGETVGVSGVVERIEVTG